MNVCWAGASHRASARDELAETYSVFQAGTDRPYPTESLPIVRALLGHPSHVDDMEIHKPDGSVTPLEVWGRPVYGAGGEIDYAIAAFADMSERQAREKIIAGQAALLELAHDAIFVRDLDGHITYWNAGAEHTYGFTRAEAVGQISHEILEHRVPRAAGQHRGHHVPARPLGRRTYPPVRRRAVHHRGEPLGGTARARRVATGIHGDQP